MWIDPSIRSQNVDPLPSLKGALDGCPDRVSVGDVHPCGRGRQTVLTQLGCGRLSGLCIEVGDQDVRAFSSEHAGYPEPDPPGPTGDERDLPIQRFHSRNIRGGGRPK